MNDDAQGEAPPTLPELQDTFLDAPTLQQLVCDLETYARVLDTRTKGGIAQRTDAAPLSLGEAVDKLKSGQVFAIQVRYLYDGSEWRDTLMRTDAGIRLVRMQMPSFT